jgi:hypothetical protein
MADDITPEFIDAVSAFTDVPAEFLTGDTAAAVWASAQAAIDWKYAAAPQVPPRPATAAVSVPSANRIVQMRGDTPEDWMAAWRAGQLGGRGAPAPPPRRTGEAHRNVRP